jgi:hypothetical protein
MQAQVTPGSSARSAYPRMIGGALLRKLLRSFFAGVRNVLVRWHALASIGRYGLRQLRSARQWLEVEKIATNGKTRSSLTMCLLFCFDLIVVRRANIVL